MGMTTTSQVLYDGNTNVVMQFTGISDSPDQENNVVKVRASDFTPVPKNLKVMRIDYSVVNGTIKLLWDADDPVPFLTANYPEEIDYYKINGMTNQGGDTATGNILLSTQGFDAGSSYSIKIEMRKKF